jgi:hypothetical protein
MPVPAWLIAHGPLVVLSTLFLVAFATVVRFSKPNDDSGYVGIDSASDCGDSDGGGD